MIMKIEKQVFTELIKTLFSIQTKILWVVFIMKKKKSKPASLGVLSLIVLGIVAYFAAKSLEAIKELDMSDPFDVDFGEDF